MDPKKDDDTSEYSSTKAPETAEHAEERDPVVDSRLIPGGAEPRSDTQQGMAGLDSSDPTTKSESLTGI